MGLIVYIGKQPSVLHPGRTFNNIERVIAGEPTPESRRLTWPSAGVWTTGTIGFLDFEEVKRKPKHLYLRIIGIEPQYQRQGFATQLILALERVAKERSFQLIRTSDVATDNKEMLALMEKLGYNQWFLGAEGNEKTPWREYLQKHSSSRAHVYFEKRFS